MIDFWNNLNLLRVSRVVDLTDLIALIALPFTFHITNKENQLKRIKISPVVPIIMASFSFMATSYQSEFDVNKTYELNYFKRQPRK